MHLPDKCQKSVSGNLRDWLKVTSKGDAKTIKLMSPNNWEDLQAEEIKVRPASFL